MGSYSEEGKINVWGARVHNLKNIDVEIPRGSLTVITGLSGSGKSSLLKTIYCVEDFDKDDAEKAEVLGRNLLNIKRREIPALRREMGIIFQDFQLLQDRNVNRNHEFVLHSTGWKSSKQIAERIEQVLEAVGMQDMKLRLPHELSGGEQQRIAIARALLNSPKIIIADEPTGNLDPETAEKIVGLLYEISHTGTDVVISTHNHGLDEKYTRRVFELPLNKIRNS